MRNLIRIFLYFRHSYLYSRLRISTCGIADQLQGQLVLKVPIISALTTRKKKHLFLGNIHLLRANSIPPWKIIENMRYLLWECDVLHNVYGRLFAKRFCNNFGKMTFSMSNEAKIVCLDSLVNISDIFLFEVTSRRHSLKSRKTPKIDSVLNQL